MAKKIITLDVCDVCGKDGGAKITTFRVSEQGGESRKVTLCQSKEHGAPVLRKYIKAAKAARPGTSTGGRPTRVHTMEEVAAARIR